MWLIWLTAMAWDGEVVHTEPRVRVDDPAWPGAVERSLTGAVLDAPPPAGVAWRSDGEVVLDGVPDAISLDALNAPAWHDAGYLGQGVRVAVLDLQWQALEDAGLDLVDGTADCATHLSCEVAIDLRRARAGFESGRHGSACAEIVRSVAPDAEIHALRVTGFTSFENAVDWAIRHDMQLLSMSMSFFNNSFYDGRGEFDALFGRLEAAGVLLVTSAGNYAQQHWEGPWIDADADGRLDMDGGNGIWLQLPGNGRRTVEVNWNEHRSCGRSDLDVWVFDDEGFVVGRGEDRQRVDADSCAPIERVQVEASYSGLYRLEVHGRRVAESNLRVAMFTRQGVVQGGVRAGSFADPSAYPLAFVVGAVRGSNYLLNGIEAFSSEGPTRAGLAKPDIAGPNGLSTRSYGAEGFFGTSASTPAVAGAIALVLSRYPELTPRQAAERLQGWAVGSDAVDDPRWGAGKARLPMPEPQDPGCGRRALWAGLFPVVVLGRRRRPGVASGC